VKESDKIELIAAVILMAMAFFGMYQAAESERHVQTQIEAALESMD